MWTSAFNIAILEDDNYFNQMLTLYVKTICSKRAYKGLNFKVTSYYTPDKFIENINPDINILLLDYHLTDQTGKETITGEDVLERMLYHCKKCKVIMVSGQSSLALKVRMLSKGIYTHVAKNSNTHQRIGYLLKDLIVRHQKYA